MISVSVLVEMLTDSEILQTFHCLELVSDHSSFKGNGSNRLVRIIFEGDKNKFNKYSSSSSQPAS